MGGRHLILIEGLAIGGLFTVNARPVPRRLANLLVVRFAGGSPVSLRCLLAFLT